MYSFGILLILAMSAFTMVMYAALAHYAYKNRLKTVRVYVKPCVTVFLVPQWENGKHKKRYYTCMSTYAVNQAFVNTMSKKYFKLVRRRVGAWLPTGRIEEEDVPQLITDRPEFVAIVVQGEPASSVVPAYCEI